MNTDNEDLKILWQLDLQKGFALDTISIYVDSISLIEDLVVKTENTNGFTGVSVKYYEGFSLSKFLHIQTLEDNKVFSEKLVFDESINFKLVIKSSLGRIFEGNLSVSLKEGKFIGISNFAENEPIFHVSQKDKKFIYY